MHINMDVMATRHGAWGGATAVAVFGTRFPSALIGSAVVGAAVGRISDHLWRGMSRADVKEFGDIIDPTKQLDVDLKDIDNAIQNTAMDAESPQF